MIRRPPRSTRTDTPFPTRRSSDLRSMTASLVRHNGHSGQRHTSIPQRELALDQQSASHRVRSEEHTSELQSLVRISYAVFCLKKKTTRYYNVKVITIHYIIKSESKSSSTTHSVTAQ